MTTPVLRDVYCADFDVREWVPSAGSPIDYWLTLEIGPDDDEGVDYFQARVAERSAVVKSSAVSDRRVLLVDRDQYSFDVVVKEIEATIATCECGSWSDTAVALSQHFLWEYEGY